MIQCTRPLKNKLVYFQGGLTLGVHDTMETTVRSDTKIEPESPI